MTLHALTHSVGLVVVTDAEGPDWSWRVHDDGETEELGGWGYTGPVPEVHNSPANPQTTLHTVAVSSHGEDVRRGIRKLVDEHQDEYGECSVFVVPGAHWTLVNWAAAGCPQLEDGSAPAPSGDELREANKTGVPVPDDRHFTTSEPRVGEDGKPVESSKEEIADPGQVEVATAAKARATDAAVRARRAAAVKKAQARKRTK